MIVDSFMFFNETNLVEGRFKYLYDSVDYFVIVEANRTHAGNPKPYNFLLESNRWLPYKDKIIYRCLHIEPNQFSWDNKPTSTTDYNHGAWKLENYQRACIAQGLTFLPDNAMLIVSDADEIPNKKLFKQFSALLHDHQLFTLHQDFHWYNWTNRQITPWRGSVISTVYYAKQNGVQHLRDSRFGIPIVDSAGWHLSYWGTPEQIQYKIENFAHQEFNKDQHKDIENIQQNITNGIDLFNRNNPFEKVDLNTIPQDVRYCFPDSLTV